MIGNQLSQRILAFTRQAFQPGRGRGMEAAALGAGQGLVCDLADQDVAEGEDIRARGSKEVLLDQLIDGVAQPLERRFQGEQAWWSEGSSKHRPELDDASLLCRELVEPGEHRGLNGVGQLGCARPFCDRTNQFPGEERVALSMANDAVHQLRRA
ncbi:MAG: hypothetical protein E6I84_01715, partial [Chloroflexi bacterium]